MSFIPYIGQAAGGLRLAAGAAGAGAAALEIPDLVLMDAAAQAARGGAGKLISESPDGTRAKLILASLGAVASALDFGLEAKAAGELATTATQLSAAGVQLSQPQWRGALEAARQGGANLRNFLVTNLKNAPAGMRNRLEKMLLSVVRRADDTLPPPGGAAVVTGDGTLAAGRGNWADKVRQDLADIRQNLEARANTQGGDNPQSTGRGSGGTTRTPNPNVTPELAAKWSNTKNWGDIESFIGQQAGATLPPGYYYRTRHGRTEIVRKVNNNQEMVPLQIADDGTFRVTTQVSNRISIPKLMTQNFQNAYGKLKNGYQIHHLIPDTLVRKNRLAQLARRLGYNLDNSNNLLGLANKDEWARIQGLRLPNNPGKGYSGRVGHWSDHQNYTAQVERYLNNELNTLTRQFGDLERALKDPKKKKQLTQEIQRTMQDAEDYFRDLINKGKAPTTPDGRLSWDNEQRTPTA
jgi:hypothetical protein